MAYYKDYLITQGDTLQRISQQQLGSIDDWYTLATFNNLTYPYIVSTPSEKIKNPEHLVTYGDKIKLPITTDTSELTINSFTQPQQQQIYDMALGMDIGINFFDYFNSDVNSFLLQENENGNDMQYVSGLANLRQSIILRLLTPKGSLILEPDYGTTLGELIGTNVTTKTLSKAQDEIIRTIKTDSRVSSVAITSIKVSGGTITVSVSITPITGEEAFTIFMEKTQEGTLTIN